MPHSPRAIAAGLAWLALLLTAVQDAAPAAAATLQLAKPEDTGLDPRVLDRIDAVAAQGIREGQMPGCVVLVARQGKVVLLRAYGDRQVEPQRAAMTTDTVFDLASLTKPVATATSVMVLVDQGKVGLDDPVARHVAPFAQNGKDRITVRDLLLHRGGMLADNSLDDYRQGPEKAWQRLLALKPVAEPQSKFIYSDVGYMVLGELVRRVSGKGLDQFAAGQIFKPLGMTETGFLPDSPLRLRAAPTEKRHDAWMRGEVHDPRAHLLGGVAGHAGLFSTARDLAVYGQMLLNRGEYAGARVLSPEAVAEMTRPEKVPAGLRALGWDVRTGYSSNRGASFSARAVGHGGFTGTGLWIDPELDLIVVFLSNRLHPDGKGAVNPLIGRIGSLAADAVTARPAAQDPRVLTGIDALKRDGFRLLAGRRVGLITNHTGASREGASTARLLHQAPGVRLAALFSPEHGWQGKLDEARVDDTRDPATGLHVFSLYGRTRKPTPAMLRGIDTLVFDIQDIGTRFYTYVSTMGYAMQAAAQEKIRFVVLDRPNPIGGVEVAGPVLDAGRESFVAFHRLPVRHGMTVGELARMFDAELRLGLDLHVVRVEGWRRGEFFDQTGLTWINPSPNMRSLTEAVLYPGIGLLETTNLSVGRGTATPFEIIGAPWLDGPRLEAALQRAALRGVRFQAAAFTPDASVFKGEKCSGVSIAVTDRSVFDPVRTGLEIARQLRALYPNQWNAAAYDRLLGNKQVLEALLAGKDVDQMEAVYRPGLEEFLKRRSKFLLYPP